MKLKSQDKILFFSMKIFITLLVGFSFVFNGIKITARYSFSLVFIGEKGDNKVLVLFYVATKQSPSIRVQ